MPELLSISTLPAVRLAVKSSPRYSASLWTRTQTDFWVCTKKKRKSPFDLITVHLWLFTLWVPLQLKKLLLISVFLYIHTRSRWEGQYTRFSLGFCWKSIYLCLNCIRPLTAVYNLAYSRLLCLGFALQTLSQAQLLLHHRQPLMEKFLTIEAPIAAFFAGYLFPKH